MQHNSLKQLKQKTQSGLTLAEVMVALAVISITLVISTNMSGVFQTGQISSYVQDLVGAINLARSEAVARSTRVTVCKRKINPTPNDITKEECDAGGSRWDNGWIVFVDTNNDATIANHIDSILRVHGPVKGQFDIDSTLTSYYVSFVANGFPKSLGGGILMGSFLVCDQRGYDKYARRIVMSQTGNLRSEVASDPREATAKPDTCPST